MYAIVEAVVNGERTKCVLLAAYRREVEYLIQKRGLFRSRTAFRREERERCLVFVPHRHAIKEILEIDKTELLAQDTPEPPEFVTAARFITRFLLEEPYWCEYEIKDFRGYGYIADHDSIIGNVINGGQDAALDIIYKCDRTLAVLQLDSDA